LATGRWEGIIDGTQEENRAKDQGKSPGGGQAMGREYGQDDDARRLAGKTDEGFSGTDRGSGERTAVPAQPLSLECRPAGWATKSGIKTGDNGTV